LGVVENAAERLERYKPIVRYDSLEAFFADSAAEMVLNPGNTLRGGGGGPPSLASLQPSGSPESYLSISGKDYRSQYVRLVGAQPGLRDRIYGALRPGDDADWLQYWFFYFYDDPTLIANLGAHEGDWEMIQLRIPHGAAEPDTAVYAQHAYASRSEWRDVEKVGDRPVVYPARGSHASYFKAGLYDTAAWFDVADGQGRSPELTLEVIDDERPPWVHWPGHWGDTTPRAPWLSRLLPFLKGVEAVSPAGPGAHPQWVEPQGILLQATERAKPGHELPVELDQLGRRLRVKYDLGSGQPMATSWLVVNVRTEGMPPRSFTIYVGRRRKGRWIVSWLELVPDCRYEVWTSLMGVDRKASPATCIPFRAGVQRWQRNLLGTIGHLFAKLAQQLGWLRTRLAATAARR
jgi:Vacuolar protein sorting-associated protein 62